MKNGLSFEESKKPVDRDTANDKELEAAWVLKEFCDGINRCPECKFRDEGEYYECGLLALPPEAWQLDDVAERIKEESINGSERKN